MEIICSGLNVVDVFVQAPDNILIGGKTECEKMMIQGGAPAGNGTCGLAALGHEVSLLCYLSNNTLSGIARAELLRHGVSDELFIYKEGATPAMSTVQVDSHGERTVLFSMSGYVPFSPLDITESMFNGCKLIYVDGYDKQINTHLLQEARNRGIESVLDLEKCDLETMREMVGLAKHSILPLEAAQILSGKESIMECVEVLSKMSNSQIVITDGINGSYANSESGEIIHQPAYRVEVVDTTGCGDAFHAGYASALVQGFDLKKRLNYGSLFAAQVAKVFGGRASFPNREFMNQNIK